MLDTIEKVTKALQQMYSFDFHDRQGILHIWCPNPELGKALYTLIDPKLHPVYWHATKSTIKEYDQITIRIP